jgi:hypothetical protein
MAFDDLKLQLPRVALANQDCLVTYYFFPARDHYDNNQSRDARRDFWEKTVRPWMTTLPR